MVRLILFGYVLNSIDLYILVCDIIILYIKIGEVFLFSLNGQSKRVYREFINIDINNNLQYLMYYK